MIPDPHLFLEMGPADFAGPLLSHLAALEDSGTRLNAYNFCIQVGREYGQTGNEVKEPVQKALMETWSVLEREGFLAPLPFTSAGFYFITRRGRAALVSDDFQSFRRSALLPKDLLHPNLLVHVWGAYVRGEYDTAVFEAFKEVEVAVRGAAVLKQSDYGTDLMRKAFNVDNGALTDAEAPRAERQALSDLFAGAIGSYKNPHSHRKVVIGPTESIEMIVLASHLLVIVDFRAALRILRTELGPPHSTPHDPEAI